MSISQEMGHVFTEKASVCAEKASISTEHVCISTEKPDFYGEATCLYGEEVTLVGHRTFDTASAIFLIPSKSVPLRAYRYIIFSSSEVYLFLKGTNKISLLNLNK